ncbi:MAG: DUF1629 domain-containing protein [Pseudomonadota bacterium]
MSELPKIWFSRVLNHANATVPLNFSISSDKLTYGQRFRAYEPVAAEEAPEYLYFHRDKKQISKTREHAFRIIDGVSVVSPAVCDVLTKFDLGATQLFEVPIYNNEKKKPSKYPPHYVLHVAETKSTFVPEASENVARVVGYYDTEPRPGAPWRGVGSTDHLAVRADCASGPAIWADPNTKYRLFFSEKLVTALVDAGIKPKALHLFEATVLP